MDRRFNILKKIIHKKSLEFKVFYNRFIAKIVSHAYSTFKIQQVYRYVSDLKEHEGLWNDLCETNLRFLLVSYKHSKKTPSFLTSGADKDYIVQISGKDLILSIVPETYSLVCTISEPPIKMKS